MVFQCVCWCWVCPCVVDFLGHELAGCCASWEHCHLCRSALPQPSDSDWDKPKPRHPIVGPASYPKSQPDVISAPGLFRKMDPEALFFAFYYQPDTYQQYLAGQVGLSRPGPLKLLLTLLTNSRTPQHHLPTKHRAQRNIVLAVSPRMC